MDALTQDQAVPETQVQEPVPPASEPSDPFAIDETQLAGMTPEARVAFDNATKLWRSKADSYAQEYSKKEIEKATSQYRDYEEQKKYADALRQLAGNQNFVQWYQAQMQQQQQGQNQLPQVATPEEWAQAVLEASQNQPQRMQMIMARQFQAMASPTIQRFEQQQQSLVQDRELDNLFRRHPDAEELDDPSIWGEGKTPLELAIHQVVDKEGKSFEEAYQVARSIVNAANARAKNAALGMVDNKRQSITEGASKVAKDSETVIEVGSAEEALRRNVEATMRGQKITYVAKPRVLNRK